MSKMFTCEEVAERYSVKIITVWDWIRKKKLPAIKIGRDYRIREEDMLEFENSRRTVSVEAFVKSEETNKNSQKET